jgi:uncharacterized membrane protein required for colicin V production
MNIVKRNRKGVSMGVVDYSIVGLTFILVGLGFLVGFSGKVLKDFNLLGSMIGSLLINQTLSNQFQQVIGTKLESLFGKLSELVLKSVCFFIGFLLIFLIFSIVIKLVIQNQSHRPTGIIDRILGAVLGFVKAFVVIELIMCLLIGITFILPDFKSTLFQEMAHSNEPFSIARNYYEFAQNSLNKLYRLLL